MKNLLIIFLFSCTAYPSLKYEAMDSKGKTLTVHEYKGSYNEHQHDIGDTVVIHTNHGNFGQISELEFDGRVQRIGFKNVVIIGMK